MLQQVNLILLKIVQRFLAICSILLRNDMHILKLLVTGNDTHVGIKLIICVSMTKEEFDKFLESFDEQTAELQKAVAELSRKSEAVSKQYVKDNRLYHNGDLVCRKSNKHIRYSVLDAVPLYDNDCFENNLADRTQCVIWYILDRVKVKDSAPHYRNQYAMERDLEPATIVEKAPKKLKNSEKE